MSLSLSVLVSVYKKRDNLELILEAFNRQNGLNKFYTNNVAKFFLNMHLGRIRLSVISRVKRHRKVLAILLDVLEPISVTGIDEHIVLNLPVCHSGLLANQIVLGQIGLQVTHERGNGERGI
jgi:hypothetical protein